MNDAPKDTALEETAVDEPAADGPESSPVDGSELPIRRRNPTQPGGGLTMGLLGLVAGGPEAVLLLRKLTCL